MNALVQLRAARDRALADPGINTSASRAERVRKAANVLERAAADLPRQALRDLDTLLSDDVLGHPERDGTVLARVAAGEYRTRPGEIGRRLKPASQRDLMDGIVDLNEAAGRPRFWWQAKGARPWSKHTRQPAAPVEHRVLRRALCHPATERERPFHQRMLAALEILWCTGVNREDLILADVADLAPDRRGIRLRVNPPGRTAAVVRDFRLSRSAAAALGEWLPVRDATVERYLERGLHPANDALFITLRHTVGAYPDGSPRMVPPGLRITGNGLEKDFSRLTRRANARHVGQKGFPVPTDLHLVSRGAPVRRRRG